MPYQRAGRTCHTPVWPPVPDSSPLPSRNSAPGSAAWIRHSADPDTGLPWRTRLMPRFTPRGIMLQSAAYIVCAYLSGMRDSGSAMRRVPVITRAEDFDLAASYQVHCLGGAAAAGDRGLPSHRSLKPLMSSNAFPRGRDKRAEQRPCGQSLRFGPIPRRTSLQR